MLEETFFPATDDHWIGLSLADTSWLPFGCSDDPESCPFLWVTGETLDFTDWAVSVIDPEPNYSGACVRILFDDLDWADRTCGTTRLPAICETD
jgi:hypothetical protein